VRIRSLSGEPCLIDCDFGGGIPAVEGAGAIRRLGPRRFAISLRRGEEIVLRRPGFAGAIDLSPLPTQPGTANSYGVRG
jgi:hypothetical protein